MSTPEKTKKSTQESQAAQKGGTLPKSSKSAKDRRAEQKRRQQRNQQVLLGIGAGILLIVVVLAIFISTRPPEATITDAVKAQFGKVPADMTGTTKEGFPRLGADNAPVTLEEFASFACPVCQQFHTQYIENLTDKISAGQFKVVVIPLTQIDYNTEPATKAAICAAQQGDFWEFHEILYDWQGRYGQGMNDLNRLKLAATALNMDTGKFTACINDPATKAVVDAAQKLSDDRKVPGTPTLYLDGKLIQLGTPDLSAMRGYIEAAVAAKPKS